MGGWASKERDTSDTFTAEHDTCMKSFVRYQKRTKVDIGTRVQTIRGLLPSSPPPPGARGERRVHELVTPGRFAREATVVPPGYRRINEKPTKEWLTRFGCMRPMSSAQRRTLERGGLDYDAWYERSRRAWLSIADVRRMRVGETVKVLMLHRNVLDEADRPERRLHAAQRFFSKRSVAVLTRAPGDGLAVLLDCDDCGDGAFEFDVEFATDRWYPLKNGRLPARDPQGLFALLGRETPWAALPPSTHVGWRGPMVPWDAVAKMPAVYLLMDGD